MWFWGRGIRSYSCDDYAATARINYENITTGPSGELTASTDASARWVSAFLRVEPGDAITYSRDYSAQRLGGGGGTEEAGLSEAGQMIVEGSDGVHVEIVRATWMERRTRPCLTRSRSPSRTRWT